MLFLGIDQHARQLTVSLRNEGGDVVLARQVSTEPDRVRAFFDQLTRDRLRDGESFAAVLEVCGFNDWLIRMLRDYGCARVILIQPDDRKRRKTDRRDAAALSELLWANRERLLHGKPVRGLRQVEITDPADQENRRLTTLRKEAGVARARLINKVKWVLRRHNLPWGLPTKTFPTAKAVAWLKGWPCPRSTGWRWTTCWPTWSGPTSASGTWSRPSPGGRPVTDTWRSCRPCRGWGGGSRPCPWPAGSGGWSGSRGPTAWPTTGG